MYLSNGLMAGETAPGGTGTAQRIQFKGENLTYSGNAVFRARALPQVNKASSRLLDAFNEGDENKDSLVNQPTHEKKNWQLNAANVDPFEQRVSTLAFGGHEKRSIDTYKKQEARYSRSGEQRLTSTPKPSENQTLGQI